jgi:DNA-directed RNA polymerase alpha subunit
MTKEEMNKITADVRAYIERKMEETGESRDRVCMAIMRAVVLDQTEANMKYLEDVGARRDNLLDRKLREFPLSVRALMVLVHNNEIETVRELVRLSRPEVMRMRSLGKRTMAELDEFVADHGLRWGMKV